MPFLMGVHSSYMDVSPFKCLYICVDMVTHSIPYRIISSVYTSSAIIVLFPGSFKVNVS